MKAVIGGLNMPATSSEEEKPKIGKKNFLTILLYCLVDKVLMEVLEETRAWVATVGDLILT